MLCCIVTDGNYFARKRDKRQYITCDGRKKVHKQGLGSFFWKRKLLSLLGGE